MKKITILIAVLLISCITTKDKKEFTLTGNLKNLKDSTLVLLGKVDSQNFYYKPLDSVYSKNNEFKFKGVINKSEEFRITFKPKILNDSLLQNYWEKQISIYLDSSKIKINGDFSDRNSFNISGSKLTELSKGYYGITEKYSAKMKNGEIELKDFHKGINKEHLDFLFENPNNIVSLTNILNFKNYLNKDSLQIFYSKLDNKLKNSKKGIALKNSFEIEKIKVGEQFIDINAKDLEGNMVKLSDFKGKVIVLDFWAIWCHYCHEQNQEEFPKLKEKYKDEDFVIISYSVDVDKKDWEKSTKADKIDWINISNLGGVSDKVVTQYGVQGYPTSFIIDKDGTILKQMNGFEYNALETELDKIFDIK